MSRVRALPIRVRVTLAFSGAMALLLAALGIFLYLRLEDQLTEAIDTGLEIRGGELAARVADSPIPDLGLAGAYAEDDESLAQALGADGRVLESTAGAGAVIDGAQLEAATQGPTFTEVPAPPGLEGPFRVYAVPVAGDRIAVVGASLDDRDEALSSLLTLLLAGAPIALLLASLAGYVAISAALRPVEVMRARATEIEGEDLARRLPRGRADDELARLSDTLNAMLARLEAAVERERRFVDDASHELRTPLALHKTALELALRYGEDDPELRAAVADGVVEVDRLIQLAEDLLVVARSEEGDLAITPERIRAADLFDAVATRFEARSVESGRAISVIREPNPILSADRLRVEQALTNLVENALRHGAGDVELRAESLPGFVRLHVADGGTGFPPEFLPLAFDRFSRAEAARTSRGSGLGLAIVRTIARAHGGEAGVANTGAGADAWIDLPD